MRSLRSASSRRDDDRGYVHPSLTRSGLYSELSSLPRRHPSLMRYGDDHGFRRYDLSRRYGGDHEYDGGDEYGGWGRDGAYGFDDGYGDDGGYGDAGGYGYGGGRGADGPYRSRGVYMTETTTPSGNHWSYGGYTTDTITPGGGRSGGYGSSGVRGRYERSRSVIF